MKIIIGQNGLTLSVDTQKTKEYYSGIELCHCQGCRNFYAQARERFPRLTEWLEQFGVSIDRPDEIMYLDDKTFIEYKKYILDEFSRKALISSKEVDALYPVITVSHPEDWLKQYKEHQHAAEVKAERDAECAATIKLINDTLNASLSAAKAKKESDNEAD